MYSFPRCSWKISETASVVGNKAGGNYDQNIIRQVGTHTNEVSDGRFIKCNASFSVPLGFGGVW